MDILKDYAVPIFDGYGNWQYFLGDKLHRVDGPAVHDTVNKMDIWYINGMRHRNNGPAIEHFNGTKEWFKYDQRHRDDGPAVTWVDGSYNYFVDGNLHRDDGPAVENRQGRQWRLQGQEMTLDHYMKCILFATEEEKVLFYLKWK